jgi:hypothetical protein
MCPTLTTAVSRHERTFAESDSADRDAGHVVHAVDGVARKSLEEAILQHGLRAAEPFLRRLEDKLHGPREVRILRQDLRSAEQHRCVSVVPAGVHTTRRGRRVRQRRLLDKGECVHVRAQADCPLAGPLAP